MRVIGNLLKRGLKTLFTMSAKFKRFIFNTCLSFDGVLPVLITNLY